MDGDLYTPFYSVLFYSNNITSNSSSNSSDASTECAYVLTDETDSLFYHLLAIVIFGAVFFNPLQGFVEAIAMNFIKTSAGEASYGAQRIFGSIGGCGSLYLTGYVVDRFQVRISSSEK